MLTVCLYCRATMTPGPPPASHGICRPCLGAMDPEAAADYDAELARGARVGYDGASPGQDPGGLENRWPMAERGR